MARARGSQQVNNPPDRTLRRKVRLAPAAGGVVLVAVTAGTLVHRLGLDDAPALRARATPGFAGAVVFALAYIAVTLTPLPKNVLSTTAGVVFGFATGLMVVWIAAVSGALLAFGVARRVARGSGARSGDRDGRLTRLSLLVERRGLWGVLLVRLVPVLPFTVVNYGSGLTTLRLREYALGTAIGILPGSAAYVALGAGAAGSSWRISAAGALVVVTIAAGVAVVRRDTGR